MGGVAKTASRARDALKRRARSEAVQPVAARVAPRLRALPLLAHWRARHRAHGIAIKMATVAIAYTTTQPSSIHSTRIKVS